MFDPRFGSRRAIDCRLCGCKRAGGAFFILRVNEWWLLGVKGVESWGVVLGDITNQYVLEGVRGGSPALALFVALIMMAFSRVGRLWRHAAGNNANVVLSW